MVTQDYNTQPSTPNQVNALHKEQISLLLTITTMFLIILGFLLLHTQSPNIMHWERNPLFWPKCLPIWIYAVLIIWSIFERMMNENWLNTTSGHFEYSIMPYGLSSASAVFRWFLNNMLCDMLRKFVIVYMDIILTSTPPVTRHTFTMSKGSSQGYWKTTIRERKCEFNIYTVYFLGNMITSDGVFMDKDKVMAVKNWPTPTTVKELQRFFWVCQFLQEIY